MSEKLKNRKLNFEKKFGVIDKRQFQAIISKDTLIYPSVVGDFIEIEVIDIPNSIMDKWYGDEESVFISDLKKVDEIKNLEDGEYKLTIVGTLIYDKGYFNDYGDLETDFIIKKMEKLIEI
jgi:hypothetical protein